MQIEPEKLSQGRMVRRERTDGTRYWLSGWDGLFPVWTQDDAAFELVSKAYAEHVKELYPDDEIRITQPYWYAGKGSEGQAIRDIWGHDYVNHKMGW